MRRQSNKPMTSLEKRAVFSLSGIFGLRIFGLFLILPVFSLYATSLEGATPFLIGMTLGAYGLTQAILQLPFGIISDRWDRKKIIIIGLLIFSAGSVIAGLSDTIYGVLVGRLIQGAGAISAAVIALMADLTREDQRTKAMAVIGIGIGFVFMLSMILGPIFESWVGVNGIFYFTGLAALLAIPILLFITPPAHQHKSIIGHEPVWTQIKRVGGNPQLRQLDIGIFILHAVLTALFVIIPFIIIDLSGLDKAEHWKVYCAVVLFGVLGMLPFMAVSHQRDKIISSMRLAVLLLCLASVIMLISIEDTWWGFLSGLGIFFVGFNTLEAMLPSLVSRIAPMVSKGTATGVYNSAQFFGVFIGGTLGGWLSGFYGYKAVFVFILILLFVWLLLVVLSEPLQLYESKLVKLDGPNVDFDKSALALSQLSGVVEISRVDNEAMVYVKFDPDITDVSAFDEITGSSIT